MAKLSWHIWMRFYWISYCYWKFLTCVADIDFHNWYFMFQALSAVYPFYFKSEEMFETLLTFLRHDDECVCKYNSLSRFCFKTARWNTVSVLILAYILILTDLYVGMIKEQFDIDLNFLGLQLLALSINIYYNFQMRFLQSW